MIKNIITDIEGTITDIHFVHQVLFPYAKQHLPDFVLQHQQLPEVLHELNVVRAHLENPQARIEAVIDQLLTWIHHDVKISPLKNLQGMLWLQGYQQGHYKGHLYQDAFEKLTSWHKQGIKLFVYSSGSIQAQQLLFEYSAFGDIRYLFQEYFDLRVGPKKEAASYQQILNSIQSKANETLFLSDVVAELDAARLNNINTILLDRNNTVVEKNQHRSVLSFDEILIGA